MIDIEEVNLDSFVIDGVNVSDCPKFCDAYIASGELIDGTPLSEDECDKFLEMYPEIVSELAYESLNQYAV